MKPESINYVHKLIHERAKKTTAAVEGADWRVQYQQSSIGRAKTAGAKTRAVNELSERQTKQKAANDANSEALAVLHEFEAEHSLEPIVEDDK